jgi:hypothetical protein
MTAVPTAKPVPKPTRRLRTIRWCFLALLVALISLTVPQVFQKVLGWAIQFGAWRHGATVTIERIDGSLWEPVVLGHSLWTFEGESGGVTRMEIAQTEAELSWKHLFRRNGERWVQKLLFTGVDGKTQIPMGSAGAEGSAGIEGLAGADKALAASWTDQLRIPRSHWVPTPAAIEARRIDFVFQCDGDYVRLEGANFTASSTESGEVSIDKVTIKQPWLNRSFRNVRGKTALQGEKIALANVVLEPGVEIRSLNAVPSELAVGQLDLDGDVAAFDGALRFEAATKPGADGLMFEASGTFGQINIAKLSSFLGLSDAAGGTIKDGKFTFRGPRRDMARAQASLRFDAVNFQWETRQWDSLALGVVIMDRRLQVPQLNLRQGKNELRLNGELTLPGPDEKWWQGDFSANVDAKIENLTELSALLLPEFKYAAGQAQIEGSVRGRGEEFNGQLLVSGSRLTWRNAPIETLHAAVKLNGKEVQIANVELINRDDYLRGRGLVKLTSPPVYWGELRLAVDDLANYAAFFQKPVLPEPLAGGAIIDWTGEGSKVGQSGKFLARLRKVRSLGATAQSLHPINAELEADYAQGSMQFSRFVLSDDDSSFTANIAVGNKALNLQGIRLMHKGAVQLEGDALLPLDVWQQWPNVSLAKLLTEDVVSRVNLTARKLDLAEASLLTGWKFPVGGIVDGTLTADGSVNGLKLGGRLSVAQGRIPLGWSGDIIDETTAQLSFRDDALVIDRFTGKHAFGEIQIGGTMRLSNLLDPVLDLSVRSPRLTAPIFKSTASGATPVSASSVLDLAIAGPLSAANARGKVTLVALSLGGIPDIGPLWTAQCVELPRIFGFPSAPWSNWQFSLTCQSEGPVKLTENPGTIVPDIKVTGAGAAPTIVGTVKLANVAADCDGTWAGAFDNGSGKGPTLTIRDGTVDFTATRPLDPTIDIHVTGLVRMMPFWSAECSATVAGPLSQLVHTYDGPPPLTDNAVRDAFAGRTWSSGDALSLEVYPPVAIEAGFGRVPLN